jgi:hypothetical protein
MPLKRMLRLLLLHYFLLLHYHHYFSTNLLHLLLTASIAMVLGSPTKGIANSTIGIVEWWSILNIETSTREVALRRNVDHTERSRVRAPISVVATGFRRSASASADDIDRITIEGSLISAVVGRTVPEVVRSLLVTDDIVAGRDIEVRCAGRERCSRLGRSAGSCCSCTSLASEASTTGGDCRRWSRRLTHTTLSIFGRGRLGAWESLLARMKSGS